MKVYSSSFLAIIRRYIWRAIKNRWPVLSWYIHTYERTGQRFFRRNVTHVCYLRRALRDAPLSHFFQNKINIDHEPPLRGLPSFRVDGQSIIIGGIRRSTADRVSIDLSGKNTFAIVYNIPFNFCLNQSLVVRCIDGSQM